MKIDSLDATHLQIKTSATSAVILAIFLIFVGIGAGLLFGTAANSPWWSWLFGGVFMVVGVVQLFLAKNVTVMLEKGGTSTIVTKKIIGGTSNYTFATQQVDSVVLTTVTQYNNSNATGPRRTTVSTLYVHMLDNSSVVIAKKSSSGVGVQLSGVQIGALQRAPLQQQAQQVADFLGVPLSAEGNQGLPLQTIAQDISQAIQGKSIQEQTPPQQPPVPPTTPPAQ